MKKTSWKWLEWFMDFLMFIVPILEMTEIVAVIPQQYLPYYMIATVILRRALRKLEDRLGVTEDN